MFEKGSTAQPTTPAGRSPQDPQAAAPQRFISLRIKLWSIIALTVLCLIGVLYVPLRFTVLGRFLDLEHQSVVTNLHRTTEALNATLDGISKSARDYGAWDDSYAYVVNPDPEYVTSNLDDAIFQNNRMNLLLIFDTNGSIVFSKTYDFDNARALPFPEQLRALGSSDFIKGFTDQIPRKNGLALLSNTAVMLGSSPILPTSGVGESRGAFIFGRFLSPSEVADLAKTTRLVLSIERLDQPVTLPADIAARLRNGEDDIVVPVDATKIQGFSAIKDIFGKPILGLQSDSDRNIYAQGVSGVNYSMLYLAVGGILFGILVVFLLQRFILARVSRLSRDVQLIGADGHASDRVAVQGNDELSQLSLSINAMLGALAQSETEHLRFDEERVKLQENLIQAQQATLDKLSTPIIPISDSVIVMPLIGDIDELRARKILESLLQGIAQHRTRTAIIDITGIFGVTDATITLLMRMIGAVHLLGTRLVLTGISAEVAQTLAKNPQLVAGISTYSNLQQAIVSALQS